MVSQITSLTNVDSTVYSGADQRKHQSSASLAFVRGIHRRPMNSPHIRPVTRKMFPFDDVISVFQEEASWDAAVMSQTHTVFNTSLWLWIYSLIINLFLGRIGRSWYSETLEVSKFSALSFTGHTFGIVDVFLPAAVSFVKFLKSELRKLPVMSYSSGGEQWCKLTFRYLAINPPKINPNLMTDAKFHSACKG